MILIRSLLFQLFLILSSIFYSLAILILAPFKSLIERLAESWAIANLGALRWLCRLDYRVAGYENLPADPAVVLAKHQSAWETIALRVILPPRQSWVLKQELIRIPLFGWALRLFHPIPIVRAEGRRAMTKLMREGQKAIEAGRWVIVFPEGTRVRPGIQHRYNVGGAILAERGGKPILPIAHNAGHFWGRRGLLKYPGTIDVVIGPLIETDGRKASEVNAEVKRWIEDQVARLPGRLPRRPS